MWTTKLRFNPIEAILLVLLELLAEHLIRARLIIGCQLAHFDDALIFEIRYLVHFFLANDCAALEADQTSMFVDTLHL